jgi:O-antigen/teichoic acid export membrane protein
VLIARSLGPAGRGAYFLPVTIVGVSAVLASLGTGQAQFRLWSRRAASPDHFVTAGVAITFISTFVALGGVYLLVSVFRLWSPSELRVEYLAIALLALPASMHLARSGNLLALNHDFRGINRARAVGAVVQAVGTAVLFALDRLTVTGVLVMYVLSIATPAMLIALWTRSVGHFRFPIPWSFIREYFKLGMQLGPTGILIYLSLRLDVFFIARYESTESVGLYSVAVTVAELVWLITEGLRFAVSERQANASETEAIDVTYRAARMTIILSVGVASAIAAAAPLLIPGLFGSAFAPAVSSTWILLPATICMAIWRSMTNAFVRFARPRVSSAIAVAALTTNVLGNVVLIPRLGFEGAAWASLLGYATGAVLACGLLVRISDDSLLRLIPRISDVRRLTDLLRLSEWRHAHQQSGEDAPPPPE